MGIAAVIGLGVLIILIDLFDETNAEPGKYAVFGAVVGALTQIGLRLIGVS